MRRLVSVLAMLMTITGSPAQADELPIPEFYGVYIVADGELHELGPRSGFEQYPVSISHTEKEFKNGTPDVTYVPLLPGGDFEVLVFVKGAPLEIAANITLRQLSFVRRMVLNEDDRNYRVTYMPNAWVASSDFGFSELGTTRIELRFKPVKDQDEMVLAVPSSPLPSGLYQLGDFLFAVPPIENAASERCIDAARPTGLAVAWRTWPCTDEPTSVREAGKPTPVPAVPDHASRGSAVTSTPNLSCDLTDTDAAVSLPGDLNGDWTGDVQQGSQRYPVQITLLVGAQGELTGTVSYPSLHCSGAVRGQVIPAQPEEPVQASVTEKIRLADRLKCLSGSRIAILSQPEKGGLEAQWFSRADIPDASALLCRP